jgi:hypothetical protein
MCVDVWGYKKQEAKKAFTWNQVCATLDLGLCVHRRLLMTFPTQSPLIHQLISYQLSDDHCL